MLILKRPYVANAETIKATITKTDTGWTIAYPDKAEFSFVDSEVEFFPDLATLWFGTEGAFLMWASETTRSKSGYMNCLARHGAMGAKPIASFFIDANGESHLFYYGQAEVEAIGTEATILEQTYMVVSEVFKKYVPSSEAFFIHQKAKKQLLARIAPEDSLAMLEAELDLLISALTESGILKSDSFTALCESINGNTADSAISKEKLLQTIQRVKTHLRKHQKTYFENRGDFTDGDISA